MVATVVELKIAKDSVCRLWLRHSLSETVFGKGRNFHCITLTTPKLRWTECLCIPAGNFAQATVHLKMQRLTVVNTGLLNKPASFDGKRRPCITGLVHVVCTLSSQVDQLGYCKIQCWKNMSLASQYCLLTGKTNI